MKESQKVLFGEFPRFVGNPHQWAVYDEDSMDIFLDHNNGVNNIYSSISHFTAGGVPITDKVSLDLDSMRKEADFPNIEAEDEKIEMMRQDDELAWRVLGTVFDDAERVAEWSLEEDVPLIGVFTGFGVHLHLLYEPVTDAVRELTSTAVKLKEELDLETIDRVPIGDADRLLRIPNCERVYNERSCHHYTIPLTASDILEYDPPELLQLSLEPREIDIPDLDRPEMEVYGEYLTTGKTKAPEPSKMKPVEEADQIGSDEYIRWYLEEIIHIPCVRERLLQPDPSHYIRFMGAVYLFNRGHDRNEVFELFESLRWSDWDPDETRKQLNNIWNNGYGEFSCETLQANELCIYPLDAREEECDKYGFSGGRMEYR